MIFNVSIITKAIKYIKNHNHFKNIDYTYPQIQKLVNSMTGRQFEIFCCELFKSLGFKAKTTVATCDGGKDIILFDNNKKIYVECKRWSGSWQIGRPEIQKLVGSAVGDKAHGMIFITTGKYNSNAIEYAKKIENIQLLDMIDIMSMINKIDVKDIPHIMERSFAPSDNDTINMMEEKFSGLQIKNRQLENENKYN